MKKGQVIEGKISYVDFPNKGVCLVDGEKVVVKNTLPGQAVRFMINKKRKDKCEGRCLEILERSPLESNEETCVDFGTCGGCLYQSIPYENQLNMKEEQILKLLNAVCNDIHYEGIKGSPISEGYRNKMEYSFGDSIKDGPLALGMHKRGSFHDIVTTNHCKIVHDDFNKILTATLEFFDGNKISFYKKLKHIGYLRHLLVRRAVKTGEILVGLVTSTQTEDFTIEESQLLDHWKECLLSLDLVGTFSGILQIKNDSLADVVKSDETVILHGQDYFFEELLGLTFKISPFSFFQTNSLGAEVLYEAARDFIGNIENKVVFDLYSGTGTIAQMLAPVAKKVIGVEIVEEAVEAAKINAVANELSNCEFIAGDVLKVVEELEEKPDFIVLDPPREGIHPKAIGKIINFGVENMLYISCKPTSLCRDLEILQAHGYEVKRSCLIDMFPSTSQIETMVLITKQKS